MREPLPIDGALPRIVDLVRSKRALVVVAPPGAGKTTRVPPALAEDGPVVVLQPRRVAARALARRIAEERGWALGEEVGWQVRFERRFGPRTRVLVATEGTLTGRLREDPLLSGFRTVVLDEFHERSIHADLALALARQAFEARDDLRLVVMSATLDPGPVAAYLGGAPVIEVAHRPHPVEIRHEPHRSPADAVCAAIAEGSGHVLVFLPGAPEIARLARELEGRTGDAVVLGLHGSLDPDAQDRAIAPSSRRKVILATNVAETSITVEGVSHVVDLGRHKVARLDEGLGLDRLVTERVSRDSADQRAGRAGRTGPGIATRLWDPREELRERREPEIERIDLAGPVLDLLAWGGDPRTFPWFEPPPERRLENAIALLAALGAVERGRVTGLGLALARFPLPPRLARVLVATGGTREAAAACAVLTERFRIGEASVATECDVAARVDRLDEAPFSVRRVADELREIARRVPRGDAGDAVPLRRALFEAYADRLAQRRAPGSPRLRLRSGHGAVLGRESGVREGEYLVALDLEAASRAGTAEAIVRAASRVEPEWLPPGEREVVHRLEGSRVRAVEVERLGAIEIVRRPVAPDPGVAAAIVARAVLERGFGEAGVALRRRLRFAGIDVDLEPLVLAACAGATEVPTLDLASLLPRAQHEALRREAPETVPVPSGRSARVDYRDDGSAVASVKLQELFGLADSPRLGPRKEPLVFELLAPNGRPVQTTRDLRSFWERTYPEVRRELRGRYPRHPWPEDPWTARATHRTRRRE
ncbi:MAG TPA: ATP-dependent helicase C-terminal domain-containing protein [Candidatus Polarisedimenticolaceae bacterium]